MIHVNLSYLISLDKSKEIEQLRKKVLELKEIMRPILNELKDLESNLEILEERTEQKLVRYFISQALREYDEDFGTVDWEATDLSVGKLVFYKSYGMGPVDYYTVKISEDLTVT